MAINYNIGAIVKPARLVNDLGNPLCEFAEVVILINEQRTAPSSSINTIPSIRELHVRETEDDAFFLQIVGCPNHRLPVTVSGVSLWAKRNPQLRGENGWIDQSWDQFANAIPHNSIQAGTEL
jgi:hypothetical protein